MGTVEATVKRPALVVRMGLKMVEGSPRCGWEYPACWLHGQAFETVHGEVEPKTLGPKRMPKMVVWLRVAEVHPQDS